MSIHAPVQTDLTWWPRFPSSLQMASPMPDEPPVTMHRIFPRGARRWRSGTQVLPTLQVAAKRKNQRKFAVITLSWAGDLLAWSLDIRGQIAGVSGGKTRRARASEDGAMLPTPTMYRSRTGFLPDYLRRAL